MGGTRYAAAWCSAFTNYYGCAVLVTWLVHCLYCVRASLSAFFVRCVFVLASFFTLESFVVQIMHSCAPPNLSFTIHCYAEYAVMAWIHAGMLSTAAVTPWGTGTVLTIVCHLFVYWLIKCVTAAPAFNLFCTTNSRDGLHFVAAPAILRRGCPARKRWPLPPVRRMVEQ